MKSFYVTGCTAGLYPHEIDAKFMPTVKALMEMGAETIHSVHLIENNTKLNFAEKLHAREMAVRDADCLVYTPDMKESLETKLEFSIAGQLGKQLRPISDLEYIRYCINNEKPNCHVA